jgi:hypothetical protein
MAVGNARYCASQLVGGVGIEPGILQRTSGEDRQSKVKSPNLHWLGPLPLDGNRLHSEDQSG